MKKTPPFPSKTGRHQDFNNSLKQELEIVFEHVFHQYFGQARGAKYRDLPETKSHRTKMGDPDFLKILVGTDELPEALHHLEIHKKDDKGLIHRCCEFDAAKVRETDLPVFTVVI